MEHLDQDELLADVLDDLALEHLQRCAVCRMERRHLRRALAHAATATPAPPLDGGVGRLVRAWNKAFSQPPPSGHTVVAVLAGDGDLPLRVERGERDELVVHHPAPVPTVAGRFERVRGDVHLAFAPWTALEDRGDFLSVRAPLPKHLPLKAALGFDPFTVVRFVAQAAMAVTSLHLQGESHAGLVGSALGVTPAGRVLLAGPRLDRDGTPDDDRVQLGRLFHEWHDLLPVPFPALDALSVDLEQGRISSDQHLLFHVLELWDTVRSGAGRYALERELGRGGMGVVWEAFDAVLRRTVALKVQREEARDDVRFVREARLTADLQHPGIVPIHQFGELEDGRIFYTMKKVEGRDLDAVVAMVHAASSPEGWGTTRDGWTLRRLVDVVARVGDTLGFAHSRGLVHCDVKPKNVRLGPHGEVQLMDWGIAAHVNRGGTPGYRSPEQADGRAVHASADVFALGRTLRDVLWGIGRDAPRTDGPAAPQELEELAERCARHEPDRRPADGAAVASLLRAWLDGVERRERAARMLDRVRRFEAEARRLRARASELGRQAFQHQDGVRTFDPIEKKRPAWRRLDEAAELERDAAVLETRYEQGLRGALELDPTYRLAVDGLAEVYKSGLIRAEAARDVREAARYATLLQDHDSGTHLPWLLGEGRLTLVTDPPGATVIVERYDVHARQLVPVRDDSVGPLGPTPLVDIPFPRGRYRLVIRHTDCEDVRYPVFLDRGEHWNGTPPGHREPEPIILPRRGSLGPDDHYVPAGWFWSGGDAEAADGLPRRRQWVAAMVVRRHPVTHAEYMAFMDDLLACGESAAFMPSSTCRADGEPIEPLYRAEDGRHVAAECGDGVPEPLPDRPVNGLDWYSARAYARWYSRRTGHRWRLPHDLEWEKAARGVDGRYFPWGDHYDGTFACGNPSHEGQPTLASIDEYPADVSPYGIRGMAGNVKEWCCNGYRKHGDEDPRVTPWVADEAETWRMFRAGGYFYGPVRLRAASRAVAPPHLRFLVHGVRLFRSLQQ